MYQSKTVAVSAIWDILNSWEKLSELTSINSKQTSCTIKPSFCIAAESSSVQRSVLTMNRWVLTQTAAMSQAKSFCFEYQRVKRLSKMSTLKRRGLWTKSLSCWICCLISPKPKEKLFCRTVTLTLLKIMSPEKKKCTVSSSKKRSKQTNHGSRCCCCSCMYVRRTAVPSRMRDVLSSRTLHSTS